jgi:hypothetical protein
MKSFLLLCYALSIAGCASTHRYGFVPASAPQETIEANERGASFPLKIGKTQGDLHMMSMGIVDLHAKTKSSSPALHLCLIVSQKQGDSAWKLNVRDLKIKLPEKGASGPAYVNSDRNEYPEVTIPPKQTRHIDLFYPLPANESTVKNIVGFDFQWRVASAADSVSGTTPFMRVPIGGRRPGVDVNSPLQHQNQVYDMEEMSPQVWWYDPFYPTAAFPGVFP